MGSGIDCGTVCDMDVAVEPTGKYVRRVPELIPEAIALRRPIYRTSIFPPLEPVRLPLFCVPLLLSNDSL